MKGIAVETVLYLIILAVAIVVLAFIAMKLIPAFGNFVTAALKGVKEGMCNLLPIYSKWIFGC
jgi:phosphotransferase system  glucose/maltose/N-acetylglucosamine-specific IIC component